MSGPAGELLSRVVAGRIACLRLLAPVVQVAQVGPREQVTGGFLSPCTIDQRLSLFMTDRIPSSSNVITGPAVDAPYFQAPGNVRLDYRTF